MPIDSAKPISATVAQAAAVSTEKKSQDIERVKGESLARLIDTAGPQVRAPREGSTFSIYA